jgi:hypothetical protein
MSAAFLNEPDIEPGREQLTLQAADESRPASLRPKVRARVQGDEIAAPALPAELAVWLLRK